MKNYVGMTVEELKKNGFKLIEKNSKDFDFNETYDVYTAYWGYMVLVKNNKVVIDCDKDL